MPIESWSLPRIVLRAALLFLLVTVSGCEPGAGRTLDEWKTHWAEEAARGDEDAAFELAFYRFLEGEHTSAVSEFERLAETTDNPEVFGMLALAYRDGMGAPVDYDRSAYWLERAAEAGDEDAARDLAAYRAHADRPSKAR